MNADHYMAIILTAFPVLGAVIVILWKYIVKMQKEGNERAERMMTVTTNCTEAMRQNVATNQALSAEIAGLKTNTLLQTKVLEQMQASRKR